jgi:hypothetical protein
LGVLGYGLVVSVLRRSRALEGTFVSGWSVRRVWLLSLIVCAAAFVLALLMMRRVDLAGLLIAGPSCALLTGRWARTAATGVVALTGALLLALAASTAGPEHWVFSVAVGVVAAVDTLAAAWLQRYSRQQTPHPGS